MAAKQEDNSGYLALRRALKDDALGTLYILHGEETYLREHYLAEMKKALVPEGMESFHYHVMQQKQFDVAALSELVDTPPMRGPRTMVLVWDVDLFKAAEETRKALAALLSDLPDYCCLVFAYDLIDYKSDARMKQLSAVIKERATVVNFRRQTEADLTDWIARRLRAQGRQIDRQDAQYLLFLCGDLMQGLIGELEKLAAYTKGPQITRADIDAVATPQLSAQVFQMTDALLRRNFDKALAVLDRLLQMQEAPIKILSVLGRQMRQLFSAQLASKAGKGPDYLVSLWGMSSAYPAKKLMEARFSSAWCRRAVLRCAQCDLAMKSVTGTDHEAQLLDLLLELSVPEVRHAAH